MLKGESQKRDRIVTAAIVAGLALLGGCSTVQSAGRPAADSRLADCASSRASSANSTSACGNRNLVFADRLDEGYTLVLPGVGGDSAIDHGVVTGLEDADVRSAVELHNWTSGGWRPVYDLCGLEHNRAEARTIAAKIVLYQEQHPGRPVHLIGYSGGGGVAVLALEALPTDHPVTSAILLGPTVAYDYDLQRALSHTEQGIYNFYSPLDVPVLGALTLGLGTTEGRHAIAAGAVGFQIPESLGTVEHEAYQRRLVQQQYRLDMLADGHAGGHFGWRSRAFVAKYVGPLPRAEPGSHFAHSAVVADLPLGAGLLGRLVRHRVPGRLAVVGRRFGLGFFFPFSALFDAIPSSMNCSTASTVWPPISFLRSQPWRSLAEHHQLGNRAATGQFVGQLRVLVRIDDGEGDLRQQPPLADLRDHRLLHLLAGSAPLGAHHHHQRFAGIGSLTMGVGVGLRTGGSDRGVQYGQQELRSSQQGPPQIRACGKKQRARRDRFVVNA